jgi:hypothetical protein
VGRRRNIERAIAKVNTEIEEHEAAIGARAPVVIHELRHGRREETWSIAQLLLAVERRQRLMVALAALGSVPRRK